MMWHTCVLLLAILGLVTPPFPAAAVTIAWDQPAGNAQTFIVQRSADGQTWLDVGTLPFRTGTNIQWTDPTMIPVAPPWPVVRYQVLAQQGQTRSPVSNMLTVSPGGAPRLAQTVLKVAAADSQETDAEPTGMGNAVDGDPDSFWHTAWSQGTPPPPPHWIVLDVGQSMTIDGLAYLPRQNQDHGRISQYQIAVSDDGTTWGTPLASGTWPDGTLEQVVRFVPTKGRYVKLTALKNVQDRAWTSAAEVGVYGKPADGGNGGPPPPGQDVWSCTIQEPTAKTRIFTCTLP